MLTFTVEELIRFLSNWTMTYSEQRQREDKNNAKVFGIA